MSTRAVGLRGCIGTPHRVGSGISLGTAHWLREAQSKATDEVQRLTYRHTGEACTNFCCVPASFRHLEDREVLASDLLSNQTE